MKGIRHVDGSLAGVFSGVLPIAAAVYGIAFLGERPTLAHGIALACVVAGIALASMRAARLRHGIVSASEPGRLRALRRARYLAGCSSLHVRSVTRRHVRVQARR